jgi:aryl carrier-like protein
LVSGFSEFGAVMLQPSLVCEQEGSPDELRELVDQGLDSINNLFEWD